MMPNIRIFGLTIPSYAIMLYIGVGAAVVLAVVRAKKHGIARNDAFNFGLIAIVGALIGAKALYIITILPFIIRFPALLITALTSGGFTFYGGLIGGIIGGYLYIRKYGLPGLRFADLAAPSVALGQAFGRVGCFFAGCCYGVETDGPLYVVFTETEFAPHGVPLFPTQLAETAANLAIMTVLLITARKPRREGAVFALYLLLYSAFRFIIEFFRGDYRGGILFLSTSQIMSVVLFIVGIMLLLKKPKAKNCTDEIAAA